MENIGARAFWSTRLAAFAVISCVSGLSGCGSSVAPTTAANGPSPEPGALLTINIGNPRPDASASCTAPSSVRAGETITVTGPMGTVQIQRQPFQLSIADSAHKTVLAEMANALPAPAAYLQPAAIPGGSDQGIHQSTYGPLGFVTGPALTTTYPATPWSGNLALGLVAGVQYTVCRVESAAITDQGLQMTLSTNDPAGRTFSMTVGADGPEAFRIAAKLSQSPATGNSGASLVLESFQSASGEAFRGFGGRHNALDQNGNFFYSWVEEENFGAGPLQPLVDPLPGTGGTGYLFPNGPTAAYYLQSLFYSSNGYGFLLNQPQLSLWSMDSDRADAWQVGVAADQIDYTVAPGNAVSTIAAMTQISGRQRLPPAWALGPMFDRAVKQFGQQASDYQSEVSADLANLAKYSMPVTGYRIEGWASLSADVLAGFVKQIRALDAHPLFYFRAFISLVNDGFEFPDTATDALTKGYVATLAGDAPYVFGSSFGSPAIWVDFTKSSAISWWQGRIRTALDAGADGFMQDFGEETQPDMQFASGVVGTDYHNQYPVDYHRATRSLLDQYAAEHPGRDLFYFTRTGYSGRPGSAASENANFPGDELTDYGRSSGLASLTTDMLNRAVGGAYGYSTDIGGYEDIYTPATTKELLLRWAEWSALSPFFRLHNSGATGTRMPWDFDQETVDDYRALAQLHQKAAPLIMKLWQQAEVDGLPPTRPLWLVYPDDPIAAVQDQEWLLGPDVLVAPVVTEGASTREVYLPEGCWTYVPSGSRYQGPQTVIVPAALAQLPYFFHCAVTPF